MTIEDHQDVVMSYVPNLLGLLHHYVLTFLERHICAVQINGIECALLDIELSPFDDRGASPLAIEERH